MGMFHRSFCNHAISRDALRSYVLEEVEQQRFAFHCPTCVSEPCRRCAMHPGEVANGHAGVGGGGAGAGPKARCYVPPRQLRAILSSEEHDKCDSICIMHMPDLTAGEFDASCSHYLHCTCRDATLPRCVHCNLIASSQDCTQQPSQHRCIGAHLTTCALPRLIVFVCRLLTAQEKHYRNVNKDKIVQCPHPDCNFWCAVEQTDIATPSRNADAGAHLHTPIVFIVFLWFHPGNVRCWFSIAT